MSRASAPTASPVRRSAAIGLCVAMSVTTTGTTTPFTGTGWRVRSGVSD